MLTPREIIEVKEILEDMGGFYANQEGWRKIEKVKTENPKLKLSRIVEIAIGL